MLLKYYSILYNILLLKFLTNFVKAIDVTQGMKKKIKCFIKYISYIISLEIKIIKAFFVLNLVIMGRIYVLKLVKIIVAGKYKYKIKSFIKYSSFNYK
ncbi:hypothetical protein H8356DRAFT_444346 [Neocallimastix lanati (nom. inval.)]|nr:hypothetical protein H8356DRAFT_444346 [Neocallimastix sp. JGI-2020a]